MMCRIEPSNKEDAGKAKTKMLGTVLVVYKLKCDYIYFLPFIFRPGPRSAVHVPSTLLAQKETFASP